MICLVTDRRRLPGGRDAVARLVDLVTAAARAGVDLIQIRERDLDGRDLAALTRECVARVAGTGTRVVVNDRADVAVAADAHGVHLRGDSMAASVVRSVLSSGALVGRSVHSLEEVRTVMRSGGLDYLIFGTLFETRSKEGDHRLATLDELSVVCREAAAVPRGTSGVPGAQRPHAGIPVLAIGGITLERASLVRRAGASGVAAIGLFIPPSEQELESHVHAVVSALRRTFDRVETVS